jgi:3-deoxy-D-manno-octulosonate 8-phosphate phosphatase (KDO 8-P phosphatase)
MAVPLSELPPERLQSVDLLILDVDGVLNDGTLHYTDSGVEIKSFNVRDGAGLKYWHRVGKASAILTGRSSPVVERRAGELGIAHLRQGALEKLPAFEEILAEAGVEPARTAYIGDDLPDIPPMRAAGLAVTVADGAPEVREFADGVTRTPGGRGAVRELVEALLKAQGLWPRILSRYFPDSLPRWKDARP